MCRIQGRRCDAKWDAAHRERYNARRRIARNTEKAAFARVVGDAKQVAYYEGLVQSAVRVEKQLDASIQAHMAAGVGEVGAEGRAPGRCDECGQFAASDHSCPGSAFRGSRVRGDDGELAVVYHGSSVEFDGWDPEYTGGGNDSWGGGFYFTHDEALASGYGAHVKSVVLNVQNPIVVDGLADPSLDHVTFDATEAAAILRHHPDIYRQPTDEEEMNPLGDYAEEFWERDEWSRAEIDSMIDGVSKRYFAGAPWSQLEGVFPGGTSDRFRRGVREATGYDGVVVDFGDEGRHSIAWFPEQVHDVSSASSTSGGDGGDGGSAPSAPSAPSESGRGDATPSSAAPAPMSSASTSGGVAERCSQCGQWVGAGHDCPQGRAHEALREVSRAWRKGWKKAEEEAFDTYGGVDHYDINAKLRSGAPLTVHEAQVVRDLDSALARAPRVEGEQTLYRAFGLATSRGDAPVDQWVEENFPEGETATLGAYTSTSPDYSVAEYFSEAGSEHTEGGVLMEIRTRQGGYTGDSAESEVLLRRGSRFEVVSNDEAIEMNGKRFRKVVLQEKASRFGTVPVSEHPLASKPAEPWEFEYVRNPVSSTTHAVDHDFGQDLEPSGRYLTQSSGRTPDGWQSGVVRFEKPLHIEFGASGVYSDEDNWKRRLSGYYGGKTGKALSKAVRADGFDAIVTHDKWGTSEIVDLTALR